MSKPILIKTLKGEQTERPPFWFMRQAGRVLPSYLAIKEKYTFWQMMQNADIGAEVTLLPINDLGVDAAILFSDILVIPHAMGMGLDFTDQGPRFDKPLAEQKNPLASLHPDPQKLEYIYKVIDKINETKPSHIPLIGFCGAPLTVLCYMLQGLSKKAEFPEATQFMYKNKAVTKQLIDAVTELTIVYIKSQIKHGISVFQLFESHAGLLPNSLYFELFMPAIKRISKVVRDANIPFIYFPKGLGYGIKDISPDVCDFMSIDWQFSIEDARKLVNSKIGLQGNLDPRILYGSQDAIRHELEKFIVFGQKNQNWVFNLGHGFMPGIPYENAKFLADWLRNANWNR